jgi:Fe-S-cluster containining protein
MDSLEAELARARDLEVADLADAVEAIGFECTRCGACCKGTDEGCDSDGEQGSTPDVGEHTATVFPEEARALQDATGYDHRDGDAVSSSRSHGSRDWRDVARPMPFGLRAGEDGEPEGETFEWALQTDACGDCTFYAEDDGGVGACTVHADRPRICRTYPFSVALGGTSQPMGEAVDEAGMVRAHECEGLGRDISRADAEELAAALKERAVTELEEAIAVRDGYEPADPAPGEVVVHDSEGAKRPDGTPYDG